MVIAMAAVVLILTYPNLPSLEILTDYRPKIPLRVYTAEGQLIGEFGEEHREVVRFQDVPDVMQAIVAAEDERFYQHRGVDVLGIARAALSNLTGGGKRQGASTITQQVAKNFFLSSEKTYTRKLYEALLSFKIENSLSKDQILASLWLICQSPKPPCWPDYLKRHRRSTRWSTPSVPVCVSNMYYDVCSNWDSSIPSNTKPP